MDTNRSPSHGHGKGREAQKILITIPFPVCCEGWDGLGWDLLGWDISCSAVQISVSYGIRSGHYIGG